MTTRTDTATESGTCAGIAEEIRRRQRFVIAAHMRPDGDAIGSQLAMAYALRHLGKEVRVVSRDPAPPSLLVFPGVLDIDITDRVHDAGDAVIVMESGSLARTGVDGLEQGFVINIDHHVGNTMLGAVNWLETSTSRF
jgi:phosphoesterase RecJ-like protein